MSPFINMKINPLIYFIGVEYKEEQ